MKRSGSHGAGVASSASPLVEGQYPEYPVN